MRRLGMDCRSLELKEALALDKLEEFVRQEEARGAELVQGTDYERALALLTVQRRSRGEKPEVPLTRRGASAVTNAVLPDHEQESYRNGANRYRL